MLRFTQLFRELDESNRTQDKVAALERYFRDAPPEDAAWGLWFLMGNRLQSVIRSRALSEWVSDLTQLPGWLVDESYHIVGDLAETVSLLLDCPGKGTPVPLHELVQAHVIPLRDWDESIRFQLLRQLWSQFDQRQCLVFNKIITGAFRVGVSRTLVVRALSNVAGIDQAVMAHRVMGPWQPSAERFTSFLTSEGVEKDPAQPYPFYLASPIEGSPEDLGSLSDWQVEWKWDGIRCQLIRRQGQVLLWSRGEDLVSDTFPELAAAAARIPDGTVLDGEILAWKHGRPLPFATLQRRLGRKKVPRDVLQEAPVAFLAYDCLEFDSEDLRERPLRERRRLLDTLLSKVTLGDEDALLQTSPPVVASDWNQLQEMWQTARERGVEGFMLKRLDSPYKAGRVKGDWWKWKIDPLTVDAVMIYAQTGHGRRANLFTDYTFGVWHEGELVPVAKAYSGLTDAEINKVDYWVKRNSLAKHGPVRVVKPELVMELAFEGIQESTRHRSGVALRFPRINRWRHDKKPQDADHLSVLREMLGAAATPLIPSDAEDY